MKALFDTNILIDFLNGIEAAREEIGRYEHLMISPITWMEVMVGASDADQDVVRSFLSRFRQVDIDAEVAGIAVSVRQAHNLRLPDAIISASAMKENALLQRPVRLPGPDDRKDNGPSPQRCADARLSQQF